MEKLPIAVSSLDVETQRIPGEAITLEAYRRTGGIPVAQQREFKHTLVTGTVDGDRTTSTYNYSNPYTRSQHAILN
jgi:hypothetical protein